VFSFLLPLFPIKAQSIQDIISEYAIATDTNTKVSLLVKLGLKYQSLHAYRKSLNYYEEALAIYQDGKCFTEKSFILKNVALCYEELHDYKEAVKIWKILLEEKRSKNENKEIINILEKITTLSVLDNHYQDAIHYSLELLSIYSANNNKAEIVSCYNNLGSFYKKDGDLKKSKEYFAKCIDIIDKEKSLENENDFADILLNMGLTHVVSGEMEEASLYMNRALLIREKQKKNIEVANILNYMAATDLIRGFYNEAKAKIIRAFSILELSKDEPRYDEVKVASYKVYCELLLRKKEIKQFKIYNDLYNKERDKLLKEEQKQSLLVLEQQVEIEKKESEIRMIQSEKKSKEYAYRQMEFDKEKKEKEVIIQSKEIELLKQARDLQLTKIRNQELDKQRIAQLLEIADQKSAVLKQQTEIEFLEKSKELQLLTIVKQSHENKLLELEKQVREQKVAEEEVVKNFTKGLVVLLLIVIMGTFLFLWQQRKNNSLLGKQNVIINENNKKIHQQNEELSNVNNELNQINEELSQTNEEINVHRENLELQFNELEKAKQIISIQNEELKSHTSNLESMVNIRTEELMNINKRLTKNNNQLEQFGFVVSHNLRGPIARLLGLASILNMKKLDDENNMLIEKMVEVTKDIDFIIHDLNQILEIQKGIEQEFVSVEFEKKIDKTLLRLENKISEKNARIYVNCKAVREVKVIKPYFESIIYNLISNALKYSKPMIVPEITITTEISGEYVLMKISDNGIGIDIERYKEKLFGLYKRFHTHVEGKGLGLYMVKTQIEVMGGKVEIESRPNVGSTFKVYFKK